MSKQHVLEKGSDQQVEQVQREDLAHNLSARIQNPLHGIPKATLLQQVDDFVERNGLAEHADAFRKGALIAQSPGDFEDLAELNADEKNWIRMEKTHKWKNPFAMYFTVILCSVGEWDQTGSNGANLSFGEALGLPTGEGHPDASKNEWIIGFINAAPYIASAGLGCWLCDPVNNWLGRRGAIFISAVFCLFPVIGQGLAQTWVQLAICRLLLGIGMGMKASSIPIFAAENTPASIRGGLVMSWQLWTAFGILLGTAANLVFYNVGKNAWRLQLGSAFVPAIPLLIGVYFCPESPRWLMKKARYTQAWASFNRLRNTPLQAARDMYSVHCQLEIERKIIGEGSFFSRFVELFTTPRLRRATLASGVVMLAQQMCGINIIAFYSSSVFSSAGYSNRDALLCSFGFGLTQFIFAFPAVWTIDTFGRRNLLLFTFPNMAWTLLAAGLCFLIPEGSAARVPLIALFIFMFSCFYAPGEGPVPFTYSAEVFPISHREVGMAWAVSVCLGFAAVLSITWPRMSTAMTSVGAFGFYAGLNVTAMVLIFFLCPETKQRTLEELDYVFAVPMSKHASYQLHNSLPYFIQRYIFRNKNAVLKPLYDFDEVEGRHQGGYTEEKRDLA
ncbi:and other transporter-domain-containing protein [Leucosporidium creatinivorum]|uniref:And other transporter-domain-containing protein n=1 Tax=Leucosporidium creatinivorum TaxID=106004 RepID=A0A1Y2G4G2_9BASI|nr:and other transporter-domain-containing protein [Leucosporidium creatinivorum]